jgi:ABC-2 type transport system permease protein
MSQYIGNALQIGLLGIAFVAASSLAFDAKPEISVFYRTRASVGEILTPRYTVVTAAAIAAFLAGTATAFVFSTVLIGAPDLLETLIGSALVALYLGFAVALVGLMASLIPSVPGSALLAIGSLIIIGIAGLIPHVGPWLPSYLVGGFDALISGGAFDYWRAIFVTVVTGSMAVWLSVYLMERRQV